jgi:hypothetical protein
LGLAPAGHRPQQSTIEVESTLARPSFVSERTRSALRRSMLGLLRIQRIAIESAPGEAG